MTMMMVLVPFMMLAIYASRYKRVPPNMAMVVFGRRTTASDRGFTIVTGGGRFVRPIIEDIAWLSLKAHTVEMTIEAIRTDVRHGGPRITVEGIAVAAISSNPESLDLAAVHLLAKDDAEIERIARLTAESLLRTYCASLTAETIREDREALATRVREAAAKEVGKLGMEFPTYLIKEIRLAAT